ncbi:MAG: cell division protein DedD [Moraxellaceae bacterium]|jgi:DedD protein|nr:cell division protein DedD [Moraxellaceae bacterium]
MEKAIKQRLLGGLVLVAGAALFLPVLLDGSGAGLTTPPIPAAPEVPGVEAIAPALDEKVATADAAVEAAHADRTFPTEEPSAAPVGEGEVAPDAAALAGEASAPAAAATPAQPKTSAPVATPPVASKDSAPALSKPAASAPAAAPVAPAVKPVAPVAKPAAPAMAPAKPATSPTATAALPSAWVVQVASLSSRDKAEALVKKLRGKGYAAVLRPQGSNWKVMVGPELNRTVADSIKARLAADPELKISGWVQAYKP